MNNETVYFHFENERIFQGIKNISHLNFINLMKTEKLGQLNYAVDKI